MDDSNREEIPDFATLAADSEIAALLDFDPVPRKIEVPDGWSRDKQREVIARLCVHGSANRACEEMGMHRSGLTKLYKSPKSKSFRRAWDDAVALAKRRRKAREAAGFVAPGAMPPTIDGRRKLLSSTTGPLPGQVMNERGEWEDEASIRARAEGAKDSICEKLLRSRRLFLAEISGSAGKRAAFEILTELPIDWEKAKRLEPQPDEPWKSTNQRQPDMILTAESGWSFGQGGYGPDKMKELREALNEFLAEEGKEPVDWAAEDQSNTVRPERVGTKSASAERSDRTSAEPSPSSTSQNKSGPRLRRI